MIWNHFYYIMPSFLAVVHGMRHLVHARHVAWTRREDNLYTNEGEEEMEERHSIKATVRANAAADKLRAVNEPKAEKAQISRSSPASTKSAWRERIHARPM